MRQERFFAEVRPQDSAIKKEGRAMNSIKIMGSLACVLCLGQILIAADSVQAQASAAGANPIVSVSAGQLRGSLTPDGVAVFKNIPFAQAPMGDLRWREPVPVKSWTGVRFVTGVIGMYVISRIERRIDTGRCNDRNIESVYNHTHPS